MPERVPMDVRVEFSAVLRARLPAASTFFEISRAGRMLEQFFVVSWPGFVVVASAASCVH